MRDVGSIPGLEDATSRVLDSHHEAPGDLGKDHDPSDGINTIALRSPVPAK
jgi:hypothetical protein